MSGLNQSRCKRISVNLMTKVFDDSLIGRVVYHTYSDKSIDHAAQRDGTYIMRLLKIVL